MKVLAMPLNPFVKFIFSACFVFNLIALPACSLKTNERHVATPDMAVQKFFDALQKKNYALLREMISTVDLNEADREAFIEGSMGIDMQGYTVVKRTVLSDEAVLFKVEMQVLFEEGGELETIEQELTARKDYHRVWRLKI